MDNSCLNLDGSGTIGADSCTAVDACSDEATISMVIGDNSCTAAQSCRGRELRVADGSCTGQYSCDFLGNLGSYTNLSGRTVGLLLVRAGSCTAEYGCLSLSGEVGAASCTGPYACAGRGTIAIQDGSCRGLNSCSNMDDSNTPQVHGGSVGAGSCIGDEACGGRGVINVGANSCTVSGSCSDYSGSLGGNGLKDLTVPDNSCNCEG